MCGRYASFLPAEAVARLFHTVNPLPNFPPAWNMAPTQDAMVVRHHPETGERHLDLLKWGSLPYFTKDPVHAKRPINARAETVATSGIQTVWPPPFTDRSVDHARRDDRKTDAATVRLTVQRTALFPTIGLTNSANKPSGHYLFDRLDTSLTVLMPWRRRSP